MEYIDGLFNIVKDYWFLAFITAILATFLESFIPALPLIAIVIANSMVLGLGIGLITSIIGSCTGTTILFLLASKFSDIKLLEKIRNNKIDTAINWVKEQGFSTLFIDFLLTKVESYHPLCFPFAIHSILQFFLNQRPVSIFSLCAYS